MQDRSDTLRRRIEFYRRQLHDGVEAELARLYLLQIGVIQLELLELEHRRAAKDGASQ